MELAEVYDGEHGLAYSAGALEIDPGHDRALQLYAYYARALQREDDVATRYLSYLHVNPVGGMAADARWLLAASYEAAGQPENAIQILEALRAQGDAQATAKLSDLYAQVGQSMPPVPPPLAGAASARGGMSTDRVQGLLHAAQTLASQGARGEAPPRSIEKSSNPTRLTQRPYLGWKIICERDRDYAALREIWSPPSEPRVNQSKSVKSACAK